MTQARLVGTPAAAAQSAANWQQFRGKWVAVHAAVGSYAHKRAQVELRAAAQAAGVLQELLKPPHESSEPPINIYLSDPIPRPKGASPDAQPTALAEASAVTDDARLVSRAWLEASDGQRWFLEDEVTRIGRAEQSHIRLDHASVSRNHAVIRRVDNRYFLEDLGSSNG